MIATAAHAGHATPTVSIAVYAYAPASISIVENDVVQFNWDGPDTNHSVTADDGSFDSGVLDKKGANFTYFFAKAGEYGYHCTVHSNMRGKVVVQPGTQYDQTAPVLSGVRLEVVDASPRRGRLHRVRGRQRRDAGAPPRIQAGAAALVPVRLGG